MSRIFLKSNFDWKRPCLHQHFNIQSFLRNAGKKRKALKISIILRKSGTEGEKHATLFSSSREAQLHVKHAHKRTLLRLTVWPMEPSKDTQLSSNQLKMPTWPDFPGELLIHPSNYTHEVTHVSVCDACFGMKKPFHLAVQVRRAQTHLGNDMVEAAKTP